MPASAHPDDSPRESKVDPAPATTPEPRRLLALAGAPPELLRELLAQARLHEAKLASRPGSIADDLRGRLIANLFFEDSTRTRLSFAGAAHRLGAGVLDFSTSGSSVSKGESLLDTARTVEAMGASALVVRHSASGAASAIARAVRCPVINAGDGRHEHPTQGLLDTLTLAAAHDRADTFDLAGLTVVIVGDIASSRVARSATAAMSALGARIILVGPPTLAPRSLSGLAPGASVMHDLDEAIPHADAVIMLRVQFERHGPGAGSASPPPGEPGPRTSPGIASLREYRALFGMTAERADRLKRSAVVMHPGPMNRGVEIDAAVADGPRSVILPQVTRGVAVRMAVLKWCLS